MSAESIAVYQARIAELEASENQLYVILGGECLGHAGTRRQLDAYQALAAELAEVLVAIVPPDVEPEGRYVVWGASDRALVKAAHSALDHFRAAISQETV